MKFDAKLKIGDEVVICENGKDLEVATVAYIPKESGYCHAVEVDGRTVIVHKHAMCTLNEGLEHAKKEVLRWGNVATDLKVKIDSRKI